MSFARPLIVAAVLLAAAYAVPVFGGDPLYAVGAALVLAVLLAAVLMKVIERHQALGEWIALELNKIRRVYHLGKNLGESDHLRAWFTELHGYVYGYLTAFEDKDFSRYEETNGAFRKVSYHVYQVPELKTDKERALYAELLDAAGTVAGARQRIKQLRDTSLPPALWSVAFLMTVMAALAILFSIGAVDRLVAGLLLSVLGLGVMMVRDLDAMRSLSVRDLSKRYVENIARLELSRGRGEDEA